MKTLRILVILFIFTLMSCESKQDVKTDINILKSQRESLQDQIRVLRATKNVTENEISSLREDVKELNIYKSGKKPKYILKLHLKQSHLSLSITKHIKDSMNAIDFELPVDKDFYNSVSVGTEIIDEFRTGSFILYGSLGDWEMTVINKEIR